MPPMTDVVSPPATYDDLRRALSTRHRTLSARLRQIAEYALENPNVIALETIAVIAQRAGVQPSSLIRFAQAFGYDGFSEMQRVFRGRLMDAEPGYVERIRALGSADRVQDFSSPIAALRSFAHAAQQSLEHLAVATPEDRLNRAVEVLDRADVIHVAAQRRSFPVAAYLSYAFGQLGRRCHLLDSIGGTLAQQAAAIRPRDALVAVSFRSYAAETVGIARTAHAGGVPIVGITDGPLSPLVAISTVCFEVEESEVGSFRSLSASMCLALSLVVGLGRGG